MKSIFEFLQFVFILLTTVCQISSPAKNKNIGPHPFPEPRFEHLTLADGLPENSVRAILQDHLGFLWFGTQNGLVKYDGYSMTVYQPDANDPLSISNRLINTIYEDKTGTLWIGTYDGLNRFDRFTKSFTTYMQNLNDSESLSSNNVNCIYEDNEGRLWIGTVNGLYLFDQNDKLFKKFNVENPNEIIDLGENEGPSKNPEEIGIYDLFDDQSSGNLYVGMEIPGLWILDVKENKFRILDSLKDDLISKAIIRDFHESKNGSFWIASNRGLFYFDPSTKKIQSYQVEQSTEIIPENNFYSLIEDQSGLIWARYYFGYYSGLMCLNPSNGQFYQYRYNSQNPSSLSTGWVWSIFEDRSGIIWVGTWDNGVNKWDRKKWKFRVYQHDPDEPQSLIDNRVLSVIEDRSGNIWVGTKGGLDRFDRINNRFIHHLHDPNNKNSLSDNYIRDIIEDPMELGTLWIGTYGAGLNKFKTQNNIFRHFRKNLKDIFSLNSDYIHSLQFDRDGFLWVGTKRGINKIDRYSTKVISIELPGNSLSEIARLYKDNSNFMWISIKQTGGGLYKLDPQSNKFTSYKLLSKNRSYTLITEMYEDQKKNFWIGTFTNGLILFDRDKGSVTKNLTQKNGLAHNSVSALIEDGSGNLWISTRNGLSKFNPSLDTFKNYGTSDGLPWDWFRIGIDPCKTQSGEIILSGNNGLIVFHPDSIRDDPTPPHVVITDMSLFNRPDEKLTLDRFISKTNEVELLDNQNDLHFEFVGLHFAEPLKNQYKYILENFDEGWVDAGTQRNATYTNLDAGEYVFKVTAANKDGVWNEEGATLKIIIPPPFWVTWYAYVLYFIVVVSALYGIRRYELNRVNWKNQFKLDEVKLKEREETDIMKSRFFANISHEFRTPLTLILGPVEKIKQNFTGEEIQKQTGLIKRNANRLLSLVNQLLDLSKLEAGKLRLNASHGNIVSFVKGIMMSFESMAEQKDISQSVKAGNDTIQLYFDKDKMAKILTNLLSNAFKFTKEGGEITAYVNEVEPNFVEIKVRDTGTGISQDELLKLFDRFYQVDNSQTREHEGTGIGLALTKELVELHCGTISVDSKINEWTEFIIKFPIGREHLQDDEIVEHPEIEQTKHFIQIPPEREKTLIIESEESIEIETEEKAIILIVEDNADVREYIKDSLGTDFQIEEASNGEQGIRKAIEIIPDLIVSDIMMPKMDGNELTRILKSDEKTSHIPIILLTAKAELESKIEGLETGADDYLSKPFDTKELQIRIKNLINIRKKLQEKFGRGEFIPKTKGKKLSNLEEQFMDKVIKVIENHFAEEEFSIEQFANDVAMSRMQLHRKLKALTGKSASLYIRTFRLQKAKKMIEKKQGNISEIAYSVGFSSPAYFTKCFKEEFGSPPSELAS